MIQGTQAKVSQLLIRVGSPHNPLLDGYGGFIEGVPRLPSIDLSSAVSSPQTNAPAPSTTLKSIEKCELRIFCPITPCSLQASIACRILFRASGYSERM